MASVLSLPVNMLSPLQTLQKNYSLYQGGGDVWVIANAQTAAYRLGSPRAPEIMRRTAAEILMRRDLECLPFASKPNDVIRQFYADPNTHMYDSMAFSPLPQPANVHNLWRPVAIHPKKGNWQVIRKHLFEVICSQNRKNFSYLLQFLAHMVQFPEQKPGVMIVLLGRQGTGKGAFFQLLGRIWRHSVLQVSDIERVTGRFNAALGQNYVVVMDEALFAGDRRAQDRVKSLITEPIISIEEKHQPQRIIHSFHRFFAASNHEHFVQVDNDDRRYFILQVSDKVAQNEVYFKRLFAAIESDDAIAAFIHTLTKIDLEGFNPRVAPKTQAHAEQKILSLSRFEKYWHHALWTAELPNSIDSREEWYAATFIPTEWMAQAANKFDPNSSRYRPVTAQEVSKELASLCPSASSNRKPRMGYGGRNFRGYDIPDLSTARRAFEAAKGFKVDWDVDLDDSQTVPENARASGRLKPNNDGRFELFARLTRQIELNEKKE